MGERDDLARRFEESRNHLRQVAYRMLGSRSEADDAVQESWLRLSRSDTGAIENLTGWLTTVVARVCLDMLRSRKARREQPDDVHEAALGGGATAEEDALLADSVGVALLVVLDTLAPAERLAFVLHDMFAVPFDDIAAVVGRSPEAARQLASRARRRVQRGATDPDPDPDRTRQREMVEAFLAASRNADFGALLALLDPEVVLRSDRAAEQIGAPRELRGPEAVAGNFLGKAQAARPILADGAVGAVWAPDGKPRVWLRFTIDDGAITGIELVSEPERLGQLALVYLDE